MKFEKCMMRTYIILYMRDMRTEYYNNEIYILCENMKFLKSSF